jgi:hypothetical protein
MFARGNRPDWYCWGNQAEDYYPEWETYKNHSQSDKTPLAQKTNKEYSVKREIQLQLLDKDQKD